MPSYRFPILIWEHHGGGYTACLVEDQGDIAAVGATRSIAIAQIKDRLQWRYREKPWLFKPDFIDPTLVWMKVEVRPEYAAASGRVMPLRETVTLRVPVVRGKDAAGLLQCSLPTLGIRFDYDEEKSLPGLVAHYVPLALKGLTPAALARHFPPAGVELDDVVIILPREQVDRTPPVELPALSAVAEPLGARAARTGLSRPWQRDAEVNRLVQLLGGAERSSVLLLGESGSGKTALLMEAVRKIERQPETAKNAAAEEDREETEKPKSPRFWLTSASRLISGMQYLGQWQQRVEEIIAELSLIDGILCVENLLDFVRTGGVSPNDSIAAFLIPYLHRGELRLVAEATPAELDACRRLLPASAGSLQILNLPDFTAKQAVDALDQLAGPLRQNHKLACDRSVIEQIHKLFARFMPYHSFPGKAAAFTVDLFDHAHRSKIPIVSAELAIARFTKMTGLPELFLRDDRKLKFDDVVAAFTAQVMGQESAAKSAAGVVTAFKAGVNDPNRPLGVLLFCGPTGVGKTELAKTISNFLFGHGEQKERMVRLDMSEYSSPGSAERIVGSPTGEPSDLIKRLRQQPFTVVLFDEIEKASPDVFDMLLGVFDEGRLTDRFGRLTTFRSALIIMTSNIGADRMSAFGLARQPVGTYDSEAMSFFRPEFFNRIDAVVTFDALAEATVRRIAIAELKRIAQREGLARSEIRLEWSNAVVNLAVSRGYDSRYGARPLQRAMEELIVTPLAKFLIARQPAVRKTTVFIEVDAEGRVSFNA